MTRGLRLVHVVYNHEEADTLMICLAAAASQRCPRARMVFFNPDTDVLVLRNMTSSAKTQEYQWSRVLWRLHQFWVHLKKRRQQHYLYSMHSLVQTLFEDSPDLAKPSGFNSK